MPLIFVYGSLKRGKSLHYLLKEATFLGEATTLKPYPLILSKSRWYPYLLEQNGGKRVKGEVYQVSFSLLKRLDRVEEVPFYYVRKKISVKLHCKTIKTWCYFSRKKRKFLKKDLIVDF